MKKLQAQGERVAFVGDGINDAPALTQADLGIAVSRASDIAREAADIILLKSEIEAVPEVLGLARATLRTIKQNLFLGVFLQRARRAAGGDGIHQSDFLRGGDGRVRPGRDRQRAAVVAVEDIKIKALAKLISAHWILINPRIWAGSKKQSRPRSPIIQIGR